MKDATVRTVLLGALMVFVGLAFKLSIVPFHFWCPDAFEGAAAEVAGYLSVASKAAAFALLIRFCHILIGDHVEGLAHLNYALGLGLGMVAALTATFGNLAAYSQRNVKRLLAYSTIAHAGYMLMAVSAMMVIANGPKVPNVDVSFNVTRAIEGLLYYLVVYLFMNLGAFAVVALIRNEIFSEEIDDYNGLAQQAPRYCLCMAVCLFSLIGLPPFGGFFAKWVDLRTAAAGRLRQQDDVGRAGDRRREHGLQPVLLPACFEGDVHRSAARRCPRGRRVWTGRRLRDCDCHPRVAHRHRSDARAAADADGRRLDL